MKSKVFKETKKTFCPICNANITFIQKHSCKNNLMSSYMSLYIKRYEEGQKLEKCLSKSIKNKKVKEKMIYQWNFS